MHKDLVSGNGEGAKSPEQSFAAPNDCPPREISIMFNAEPNPPPWRNEEDEDFDAQEDPASEVKPYEAPAPPVVRWRKSVRASLKEGKQSSTQCACVAEARGVGCPSYSNLGINKYMCTPRFLYSFIGTSGSTRAAGASL
jgi:hypothetical protein